MSEAPVNVAEPAAQQERRTSRAWLRWGLGAWWVVILYLALNLRDTIVSALWPALHDWLQALLALVGSWPLLAQIGFWALVALALGGLAWLTYLAFWTWRKAEQEAARAEKAGRIEELKEGNKPLQQPLEQLVELTKEQNELLSQRQEQQAPPLSPGVIAPTGMPRAASLIGRDAVLADLMAKLRAGATMGIFALRGMGGVGKTALAAEAVARLASERGVFPGGAAWISCETLTGSEGLAELWGRVARALGLEQVAARPDPQTRRAALASALTQRERLLLALDNIEPGLDADAALDTLAVDGHTALLLTARHAVAPHRLTPIEITPLEPPDARALFAQQLQKHNPARPTAEDEQAVPKLLEALGGLPLALELTAAYAGLQRLPLAEVLREVEADGLNAAAFRADPKRALARRFDRSWLKLTGRQQRLFAGLSLLEGASFPREAALALARATLAKANAGAASDLKTLVDYALVEPLEGGRLRLHPLLREYAEEKLRALPQAQRERLGDAMVAYWLAYARAHPGYEGMDALEAEAAGLMGALAWAQEQARHREVLGLAHALSVAWNVHGRWEEARSAYAWAGLAAQGLNDQHEQFYAAHELAVYDGRTGRVQESQVGYERALKLAEEMGDLVAKQKALHGLAVRNAKAGRLSEARAGYERALALAQQLGDLTAEQREVDGLAVLDRQQGRLVEARAGYERALALARQLGDPAAERDEVHELAVLDFQTGRLVEARAGYERALALAQQLHDPAGQRAEIHSLAVLDRQQGRLEEARAGYERALALARELGDPSAEREEVHALAVLDAQQGRLEEARAGFERALALARELGDPSAEREEVHALAVLDAQQGRLEEARAGYERALALARELGDPSAERAEVRELAVLDEQEGRLTEAQAGYERALELARQLSDPAAEATGLRDFGDFLGKQGQPERGRALMLESLALYERLNDPYNIAFCHQYLAWLEEREGTIDAAIAHYREALRCFEQVQSPDAEEVRADLRRLEAARRAANDQAGGEPR
jgi:Tfp pilus assembly protein PilF